MESEGVDQVEGDYGLHHHLGGKHDHRRPVEELLDMAMDASFIA